MHKKVNFMVDESLAAYFCQKLAESGFKNKKAEIRDLLAYSESANPFSRQETDLLIKEINDCKIIDIITTKTIQFNYPILKAS